MKTNKLFKLHSVNDFNKTALNIFRFQATNNLVYQKFLSLLNTDISSIKNINEIPFLPIQFFKSHTVISSTKPIEEVFLSSGTTGVTQSKHFVTDLSIYETSFNKGFEFFYGSIENFTVLALLPSYLERDGSSLIYMVNDLIKKSKKPKSGFYLNNLDKLWKNLVELDQKGEKILLIGVSFALLDLVEKFNFNLKNTIVIETGGMKGRRKELIREELHEILCKGFGVEKIHSEYGMTELLSQAYSKGNGIFECPPWMKILTRDTEDALTILPEGKSGGINVIDLANINSCSFIATQDLGKTYTNGTFEVLGRFDNSDIRGCNLLVLK
ncbi:acyl-protein synthetase LuxE [Lutibacter oceani]|uniref:Acyl-protein synthetase LuxE n=1 Tax=Lutibacter oceani TaxID=1853311 RepID=A0A3D9S1L4_9FLAO|nr:acyl transferase [Lutibacter oceani]REE83754.1 acyl-protein synthetase LuxE [Lutibacter oceani]